MAQLVPEGPDKRPRQSVVMSPESENPSHWTKVAAEFRQGLGGLAETTLEALRTLVHSASESVQSAESSILVPSDDGQHLRFLVSVNRALEDESITVPLHESIAGYVYNTGQTIAVDRPDDYYRGVDAKVGTETREYIAAPIIQGEHPLGVQTFMNRPEGEDRRPFSAEEIDRAQTFATLAAVGLRFYQRLEIQLRIAEAEAKAAVAGESLDSELASSTVPEEMADQTPLVRILAILEGLTAEDQKFFADLAELLSDRLRGGSSGEFRL